MTDLEKELVKKWREPNVNVRCDENDGSVSYDTSYDATRLQCADELETWLAANLERIKAEARLEGEISEHKRTCQMYWHVCRGNDARCSEGYTCERLAALEAQAKEKP